MLAVTHTSSVTEDQIDHLGHMNVRFYGSNAHAATRAVLAGLDGWPDGPHFVHETYTRHHREQLLGTPLLVRSALLDADVDGLRIHHELVPSNAEALAATFVHRVSPIDEKGERLSVPDAVVAAAGAIVIEPPPYAAPRTIDLDGDVLATAPPLEVVRERGLDVRKPRTIAADECDDRGGYLPEAVMMLLWGGDAPDHVEGWGPNLHEGPDGELMGWALMETRVQLDRLPRIGTRIQSFGATIALHERATHRMHWCYDLDRGDLLCAFEAVDVAFDTRARRTMVIPESIRRRQESVLHADLAPS
ncbi:MAG: thioesterase family protein [Acidimicrobiales bacterium]